MVEEQDIFSKSGLNSMLNGSDLPENPFEAGQDLTDEQKRGTSNELSRHPALTNSFSDMSFLDNPTGIPGGKQPDQPVIPTTKQVFQTGKATHDTTPHPTPMSNPDSELMESLLGLMMKGPALRSIFSQKIAELMMRNPDIMQSVMGQISQNFIQK